MKLAWTCAAALAWTVSSGGAASAARASGQDDLLYDELGKRWLQRHALQSPGDWNDLLTQRFGRLELGVFEVYLPEAGLREGKGLKDAGAALLALIDAQQVWSTWVGTGGLTPREADALTKWLRGWSPKTFSDGVAGVDLLDATRAPEELRATLERYRTDQRAGHALGLEHAIAGVPLVIFPQRAEFVEFTCLAGALDARLRPTAWNGSITTWLEYQADQTRFLTLEYGTLAGSPATKLAFEQGVSVAARNPAALSQLVAQVALRALLARMFPDSLDPALSSGMANALVIDLYGELDTRIDGDVRARSSQGTSVFIPGGNPSGGVLPPTSAENRWRGTKGKDHFVGVLAQVQKRSGKKAHGRVQKLVRFELQSVDESRNEVVSAPFLGPKATRPSDEILPDYLEFLRCYGVAFLHWLRSEGAGKPSESSARFAEFLRRLGRSAKTEDLPTLMAEVYGRPLSAAGMEELFEEDTLEARFLTWLAK